MKYLFFCLMVALLLGGCASSTSTKLSSENTDSPCGCVTLLNGIVDDILDTGANRTLAELEKDKEFMKLMNEMNTTVSECEKFSFDEIKDCDDHQDLAKKMDLLNEILDYRE